jgi:type I restriction enzyme M protein
VILPFTVLRRLDCTLEATKADVLAEYDQRKDTGLPLGPFLTKISGVQFYNTSPLDVPKLLQDAANIQANLAAYVGAFSDNVRDIFERYDFLSAIAKLDQANLLYQVVQKFAAIDLHPEVVSNADMGLVFEELIRKFAELSNETAGELTRLGHGLRSSLLRSSLRHLLGS